MPELIDMIRASVWQHPQPELEAKPEAKPEADKKPKAKKEAKPEAVADE